MAKTTGQTQLTLYSSQVSDCSARLRIALNLKGLAYRLIPINMRRRENQTAEYAAICPSKTVPTLVVEREGKPLRLCQSIATLEYLEEAFPGTRPLLPSLNHPELRAQVRSLVGIIATDIHPLDATPRVGRRITEQFAAKGNNANIGGLEWDCHWIERGLQAYEDAVEESCGKYSVGDLVTLADVVLVPELWTGLRFGVNMEKFPNTMRIYQNLSAIDGIVKEKSRLEED